nr:hypothetical transcript [Hymenolepis microstoma]
MPLSLEPLWNLFLCPCSCAVRSCLESQLFDFLSTPEILSQIHTLPTSHHHFGYPLSPLHDDETRLRPRVSPGTPSTSTPTTDLADSSLSSIDGRHSKSRFLSGFHFYNLLRSKAEVIQRLANPAASNAGLTTKHPSPDCIFLEISSTWHWASYSSGYMGGISDKTVGNPLHNIQSLLQNVDLTRLDNVIYRDGQVIYFLSVLMVSKYRDLLDPVNLLTACQRVWALPLLAKPLLVLTHLEGGKFNRPNRLFYSVAATWSGCLESNANVKELIAEIFFFLEMFENTNGYDSGTLDDGTKWICSNSWIGGGIGFSFCKLEYENFDLVHEKCDYKKLQGNSKSSFLTLRPIVTSCLENSPIELNFVSTFGSQDSHRGLHCVYGFLTPTPPFTDAYLHLLEVLDQLLHMDEWLITSNDALCSYFTQSFARSFFIPPSLPPSVPPSFPSSLELPALTPCYLLELRTSPSMAANLPEAMQQAVNLAFDHLSPTRMVDEMALEK